MVRRLSLPGEQLPIKNQNLLANGRKILLTYFSSNRDVIEYAEAHGSAALGMMSGRPDDGDGVFDRPTSDCSAGFDCSSCRQFSTVKSYAVEIYRIAFRAHDDQFVRGHVYRTTSVVT